MNITSKFGKGFTLIELMVTIAIVIIITIIAVPALNKYIAESKVADALAASETLQGLINENISSNETVTDSGVGITLPSRLGRYVATFSVSDDGVISFTTTAAANSISLTLTPAYDATLQEISWVCAVTDSTKDDLVPNECRI